MKTALPANSYKNHRFPAEIIRHAVWLYSRFCLSYRDVEELLFARGVTVTYEAIRTWCRKFGQAYANQLRRRHSQPGDKWHLDEVFLTIQKKRYYLWQPVDQDGHVLDILEQFSGQCRTYPLWANHALASDSVMVASADATAVSSASRVRALAARKKALIFDQHCSIGFRSGEYGGR
jgi:DDE domain